MRLKTAQPAGGLSLRQNFSWTFAGNLIYAACQWAMLVLLAKLGSPEMVGQFTLGLAIATPITLFSNLQLRAIQATDAKNQYRFTDYLELRLLTNGLAFLAILSVVVAAQYRTTVAIVIILVGIAKLVESVSDVFYGLLQHREQMDRIAQSMIIKGLLSLLLLGSGIVITKSVIWGVLGLAIAWSIVLCGYDYPQGLGMLERSQINPRRILPTLRLRWRRSVLWQLTKLSFPLGLAMMLISLQTNVPRYFLEAYLGERSLGIFAAIAYIPIVGTTVVAALGQSATPRLSQYYIAGEYRSFQTLMSKLLKIGLGLGLVGLVGSYALGKPALTILYSPEYAEQGSLFVVLMAAAGVSYVASFLGYGMTAAQDYTSQIPLFLSSTVAIALGCLVAVPKYGLMGAAIAVLLGSVVQLIISWFVLQRALQRIKIAVD